MNWIFCLEGAHGNQFSRISIDGGRHTGILVGTRILEMK